MTERKPPQMSFPDWVDHQIRTAEAEGAFENLAGKGKPIPRLGEPRDDMAWIAEKMRSENVDVASALPPALALAKEVETLDARLAPLQSERLVREYVDDLNVRIRKALVAPQVGPPVRTRPVDLAEALQLWRASRPARRPVPQPAVLPTPSRRRRWWRRRST